MLTISEKQHIDRQMPMWNWFSILSLLFGITTLCTSLIPLVNIFWVPVPIGFGIFGILKSRLKIVAALGIGFSCLSLLISFIFIGIMLFSYALMLIDYFGVNPYQIMELSF